VTTPFDPLIAELKQQHTETRDWLVTAKAAGLDVNPSRHLARVRIARVMHALAMAYQRNPEAVKRLVGEALE
jgi:K+-transporting ATPase c subunit